jgi:hypothetical protein
MAAFPCPQFFHRLAAVVFQRNSGEVEVQVGVVALHSHSNGVPVILPNFHAHIRQQGHQHQPQTLTSSTKTA